MAHFLCHLGAHILEPFCSISILPKTVISATIDYYHSYYNQQLFKNPAEKQKGV